MSLGAHCLSTMPTSFYPLSSCLVNQRGRAIANLLRLSWLGSAATRTRTEMLAHCLLRAACLPFHHSGLFMQYSSILCVSLQGGNGRLLASPPPLWPCSRKGAPSAPRSSGIRTHGLHHPKMARYQAALCSVLGQLYCTLADGLAWGLRLKLAVVAHVPRCYPLAIG